jgi:hypothetical protein
VVQAVTVIMGVSLTFGFSFGNVLNLALRLGQRVDCWSSPAWSRSR